ncbi:MarR family transcriptional regulator [Proteiniclasticum sp.]|uniref:MarR family winged helix-turn-helix transcriptional regulator n=1 Tax=Proteiniclasticum sp. TaxID=2053595 RepID=UPI00289FF3A4|nr:MarR family transcriptional regulator [Proteiniclasticum sp.]
MMMEKSRINSEYDVLGSAMRLVRTMKRRERLEGGASRGMMRLLAVLSINPGISPKALAEHLEIRPASLSERIRKLEEEGIVRRDTDEGDLRRIKVTIMPRGEAILKETRAMREEDRKLITEVLSEEEQKMFCQISQKLVNAMESIRKEDVDAL